MPMNGFMELKENDLMAVDGGVNYDRIFAGFVTYAGATLAIAAMSEPIGWIAAGAYLGISAASGAYMGYGFATD
ncbi:bacteriocin-type signal sequence [Aceticella autotrophica]|uniref:Bacteriocin-type signal sequence n=2 Tax=Aceticella autotrophica TaxID=2755338 RepID=A0A975AXM2_9THEO|nr:bacteriocin-type signal sequence [Aceticella autotrophica]